MALVPHKITALAESDAQGTDGKNIVAGAVVSLYDTTGAVVTLFDDANGTNGSTAKQTDAKGQVVVFVTPGEYDEEVNGSIKRRVLVGNKEITTEQLIDSVRPSQDGDTIMTTGFTSAGDGGGAQWRKTASTGTPSQTPSVRLDGTLTDATGAVWEIVEAEVVRPEMFGAVGDGIADDAGAVQAAINSPQNNIAFGAKTYRVNQLTPKSGQAWSGVAGVTKLKVKDSAGSSESCVALPLDNSLGSLTDFYAFGIIFDSNQKATGFLVNGAERLLFDACEFSNNETYGFAAQVRPGEANYAIKDNLVFINCKFNDNSTAPVTTWDGVDIKYGTNIKFVNCEARNNANSGFDVRGQVEYVNCQTSGNGIIGFHLETDNSGPPAPTIATLTNCSSEQDAEGVRVSAASANECIISGDIRVESATGTGVALNAPVGGGANGIRGSLDVIVSGCVDGVKAIDTAITSLKLSGVSYNNSNHGMENDAQNLIIDMVFKSNGANGYRELSNSSNNLLLPSSVVTGNASGNIPTRVGGLTDGTGLAYETETKVRTMPHLSGAPFFERVSNTLARVGADGNSANIDLELTGKGTGKLRFGQRVATADSAITGYIEIKDASGTTRKLAVID